MCLNCRMHWQQKISHAPSASFLILKAIPKAAPIQLILPAVYNYFSKVFALSGMADKTENAVKPLFYNNIFAAKQALATLKNYGYEGVEKAILLLHAL